MDSMIKSALIGFVGSVSLCASTLYYNGKIYTVDPAHPWAQAMVIDGNKIDYVGSNSAALQHPSITERIDLKGAFVMPGIIDAHTHVAMGSLFLSEGVNLTKIRGKKAIFDAIGSYAKNHPEDPVITGFGFYPYALGKDGPTALQLDVLIPDKPAFIVSNNGHSAWVNTKALERLMIDKHTPDPKAGIHYYVRDTQGNPTGFLIEGAAFWSHLNTMGIGSTEAFERTLGNFLPQFSALGVTSLFDAGTPGVEENSFRALRNLEKMGRLPLRYFGSHFLLTDDDAIKASETFSRYAHTYNSDLIRIGAVKFSNDNSSDEHFAMQFGEKELIDYFIPLMKNNIDVMVHTSNDLSTHSALNAIQKAKKGVPKTASRFALAHVNMVRDNDFDRFKKLGVIANIQTFNAQGEGYYNYRYMLYGEKWENKLARYNTFFKRGVTVSASSDYPACNDELEGCGPFYAIEMGLTRQKVGSSINAPILPSPNERLNLAQMIQAYTINAAYQLHQEHNIGSLIKGKFADFIILDHNPFELKSKDVHTLKVLKTYMGGRCVYEKNR